MKKPTDNFITSKDIPRHIDHQYLKDGWDTKQTQTCQECGEHVQYTMRELIEKGSISHCGIKYLLKPKHHDAIQREIEKEGC